MYDFLTLKFLHVSSFWHWKSVKIMCTNYPSKVHNNFSGMLNVNHNYWLSSVTNNVVDSMLMCVCVRVILKPSFLTPHRCVIAEKYEENLWSLLTCKNLSSFINFSLLPSTSCESERLNATNKQERAIDYDLFSSLTNENWLLFVSLFIGMIINENCGGQNAQKIMKIS